MLRLLLIVTMIACLEETRAQNRPDRPAIDHAITDQIAMIVNDGIKSGEMPGAVVGIANRDHVLYLQAFGDRRTSPLVEPMTVDTVFDLASLTKPIATGTSIMRLVSQGKLEVETPVAAIIPEFASAGKEAITIGDLLLHVGGLIPDNSIRDYQDGPAKAWPRIFETQPRSSRGELFAYTDVGFLVLGQVVQRVSGKTLDEFASENIFKTLGMDDTGFNPGADLRGRTAATEKRHPGDHDWIQGEVHDPRAYLLGGVAGHAGLFSTAGDLVRFGQMMLGRGKHSSQVILDEATFDLMTRPRSVPTKLTPKLNHGTRTYAWDHRSPYSSNRGETFSEAAFGHGGFTGTVMWIDPKKDLVFIFLSNRLHPDGKGSINRLAGRIATLVGRLRATEGVEQLPYDGPPSPSNQP